MAAQLRLALDNVEAVLTQANMTLANVVRLNIYTTDVDTCSSTSLLTQSFEGTNGHFASTLLGVARLVSPHLLVALEATAMD